VVFKNVPGRHRQRMLLYDNLAKISYFVKRESRYKFGSGTPNPYLKRTERIRNTVVTDLDQHLSSKDLDAVQTDPSHPERYR
jgi:hypothetical protein